MKSITQLAKGTPTYDTWTQVVRLLDGLSGPALESAVDAFEAASAHWPTTLDPWSGFNLSPGIELRRSPNHWVKEVYLGAPSPKHRLIRILETPTRAMKGYKLPALLDASLDRVRQVGFNQVKLPAAFLKSWRGEGHWRRWEALRLWTCDMNASNLKVFVTAELSSLRQLNLEQNRLGEAGVSALVKAPALAALSELHLGNNALDAGAAQALARASWMRGVQRLDLGTNPLDDTSMERLTEDGAAASLRWLRLSHSRVGEAPGGWVAALPALETLELNNTLLRDDGLVALLDRGPALHSLNLDASFVGDRGAARLAEGDHAWRALSLRSTALSPAGLGTLLRSPALAGVERLELGRGLDLGNARLLIEGACPKLRFLWWQGPEIGEGVEAALRGDRRISALLPY